ncbi:MAG TPA: SDR family oxidoreductase [Acidimicrobiales bacterium]|nr:SDR family oxidoreductase [Acidimicrobiales bacterium]
MTGASGKVGGQAMRRLVEKGLEVRTFTRDPAKIEALGLGVEAVGGDLDQPETIPPALAGVEQVLVVAGGWDIPGEDANMIEAAETAGVGHLVLLSSLGVEAGVASGPFHAPGEEKLRSSGLTWTILRPGFYMANAFMWHDTVVGQGVIYEPTGTGRHALVHPADVGDVAAEVLATDGHGGRTYELTGPEALSSADCAAALAGVLGREISHVDVPDEAFRQGMAGAGVPAPVADNLARYYAMVKAGDFAMVTQDVPELLGRPARTFREWAAENAGGFAA